MASVVNHISEMLAYFLSYPLIRKIGHIKANILTKKHFKHLYMKDSLILLYLFSSLSLCQLVSWFRILLDWGLLRFLSLFFETKNDLGFFLNLFLILSKFSPNSRLIVVRFSLYIELIKFLLISLAEVTLEFSIHFITGLELTNKSRQMAINSINISLGWIFRCCVWVWRAAFCVSCTFRTSNRHGEWSHSNWSKVI